MEIEALAKRRRIEIDTFIKVRVEGAREGNQGLGSEVETSAQMSGRELTPLAPRKDLHCGMEIQLWVP